MTPREKEVVRAISHVMRGAKNKKSASDAVDAFVMLYLPGFIRIGQPYIRHEAMALLLDKLVQGIEED